MGDTGQFETQFEDQIDPAADTGLDTGTETGTETGVEPGVKHEDKPSKPETVRESIARSLKEMREKPQDDTKPPAKQGAAAPGPKAGDQSSKTTPPQAGGTPPTSGVPDAWKSKELAPVWSGLAPVAQAAIQKREADMAKGVEQLKTRHQELDGAVAPYRETIKRFGFTEGQAVDQLFKWQMALAGPDKIRAFVALMQSHGVDPASFAAAITGQRGAAQPTPANGQLPPQVQTELEGIKQKLGSYDQHFAAQQQTAAQHTVTTWAKDKPHYNAVRQLMGQLIQSGAVKPSETDPFALDAAYDMAIHSHPETRTIVATEARNAEIAARKATAEKARKAGSSMRPGAPAPPTNGAGPKRDQRNETVRDSITRALADLRAGTPH